MRRRFLFFLGVLTLAACSNEDKRNSRIVSPDAVYFDYKITAEEENGWVNCMFRYTDGPDGQTLLLEKPQEVKLDGQPLQPDSARFTGVYYEVEKPAADFLGKHSIEFTSSDKKLYKEDFEFRPFRLAREIPETVSRTPFSIELENLPDEQNRLHVVITDTAYETNDVNEIIMAVNGKVDINQAMLNRLAPGPVTLEISSDMERPLRQPTKMGGRLMLHYGLKRDFEIKE